MSFLLFILAGTASAQDAYDAHGFVQAPSSGQLLDGLGVYSATAHRQGAFSGQALFEYADDPFVVAEKDLVTGQVSSTPLLHSLIGVNMGGYYALSQRIAFAGTMPLWFSARGDSNEGAALGDLTVSAPINLLLRDPSKLDLGLALVPTLGLPTGNSARYLGDGGLSVGGLAVATVGGARWNLSANGGIEHKPEVDVMGLRGGWTGLFGASAGVAATEQLGLVAELRGSTPLGAVNDSELSAAEQRLVESPLETGLSARYRLSSGLSFNAGAALGLSAGAGAADFRAFAGLGFASPDREVITTTLVVTVQDPSGSPVGGARVMLDGQELVADPEGHAQFVALQPGQLPLDVSARLFEPVSEPLTLIEGPNQHIVVLDPVDGTLKVLALANGQPIDGTVRFLSGPEDHSTEQLGADGEVSFDLAPGQWRVLVSPDGRPQADRIITLASAGLETILVEFEDPPPVVEDEKPDYCTDKVLADVYFDFDIDTPRADSMPVLYEAAQILIGCPDVVVELGGHTDWIDTDEYNIDLSQRRMNSVKAILVSYGVPAERLWAQGYGESRPIATNETDEGRALNRRVEFTPLGLLHITDLDLEEER